MSRNKKLGLLALLGAVACLPAVALGAAEPAPPEAASAAEKIEMFEHRCSSTAAERGSRNSETTLYHRLGGTEDSILRLTRQLMRYHYRNDALYGTLRNYSPEELAAKFTPYLITLTGGPQVYRGGDLRESHRNLHITNEQFVAGGEDLMLAMAELGYGPAEVDDLMCAVFDLRDQVILSD